MARSAPSRRSSQPISGSNRRTQRVPGPRCRNRRPLVVGPGSPVCRSSRCRNNRAYLNSSRCPSNPVCRSRVDGPRRRKPQPPVNLWGQQPGIAPMPQQPGVPQQKLPPQGVPQQGVPQAPSAWSGGMQQPPAAPWSGQPAMGQPGIPPARGFQPQPEGTRTPRYPPPPSPAIPQSPPVSQPPAQVPAAARGTRWGTRYAGSGSGIPTAAAQANCASASKPARCSACASGGRAGPHGVSAAFECFQADAAAVARGIAGRGIAEAVREVSFPGPTFGRCPERDRG